MHTPQLTRREFLSAAGAAVALPWLGHADSQWTGRTRAVRASRTEH